MPLERQQGSLPRWVRDPRASDWVTEAEVLGLTERERERAAEYAVHGGTALPGRVLSHEAAGRSMAQLEAFWRFVCALDITYGRDVWPSEWVDGPMPWESAPGGPPEALVARVSAPRGARTGGIEPGVPGLPGLDGLDD